MSKRIATIALAGVLVAVFLAEVAVGAAGTEAALLPLGALRTRGWSARDSWRVLTFSFLHLNALHLTLNAAGLLWLGAIVERRLGPASMLIIFAASALISGVAGMLLGAWLPTTGTLIGASGAVFGLLAGALIVVSHRDATERDRRLRRPLIIALVAATAASLLPGVSIAGHLGGFVGGALVTRSILA